MQFYAVTIMGNNVLMVSAIHLQDSQTENQTGWYEHDYSMFSFYNVLVAFANTAVPGGVARKINEGTKRSTETNQTYFQL